MPWNLLILPLVSAYFILTRLYYFKYRHQRLEQQRLIFETIFIGVALAIVTYMIRLFFEFIAPDVFNSIHAILPFKERYFGTSLASFIIAYISVISYNKVNSDTRKFIFKAIKKIGNEFELITADAFKEDFLLLFTLNNGKIYIGWVKELPIPSVSKYLRIIPAISGYRNEMKEVKLTTHYLNVYANLIRNGNIKSVKDVNFDIVLDIDAIISVSYFDPSLYSVFNDIRPKE
jgi:hypothetical protein